MDKVKSAIFLRESENSIQICHGQFQDKDQSVYGFLAERTIYVKQDIIGDQAEFLRTAVDDLVRTGSFCDVDIIFENSQVLSTNRFVVSLLLPGLPDDSEVDKILLPDYSLEQFLEIRQKFFSASETLTTDGINPTRGGKDYRYSKQPDQNLINNVVQSNIKTPAVIHESSEELDPEHEETIAASSPYRVISTKNTSEEEGDVETIILEVEEDTDNIPLLSLNLPIVRVAGTFKTSPVQGKKQPGDFKTPKKSIYKKVKSVELNGLNYSKPGEDKLEASLNKVDIKLETSQSGGDPKHMTSPTSQEMTMNTKENYEPRTKCRGCVATFTSDKIRFLHETLSCNIYGTGEQLRASQSKGNIHEFRKIEESYSCDTCEEKFSSYGHKSRHQRLVHKADVEGSLQCEVCNKILLSKPALAMHIARHSENRDFICDACPEQFKTGHSLLRHQTKEHEDIVNKQPFSCRFCEKVFRFRIQLVQHERVHTKEKPFKCDLCSKAFSVKCNLKIHMETHKSVEERKYKCPLCSHGATSQVLLDLHMNSHSGVRPYTCKDCGNSYKRPTNLRRHMKGGCKNLLGRLPALKEDYELIESVVYATDDNVIISNAEMNDMEVDVEVEETTQFPFQEVIEEVVVEDQIQYIIADT